MQKTGLLFMIILFLLRAVSCNPELPDTGITETTVIETTIETAIPTEVPTAPPTAPPTIPPTAPPTVPPTAPPTAAPTEPLPPADLTLLAILGRIISMEEGTAGSSLKTAAIAGALLDWVEVSPNTQTQHEIQVSYFLSGIADPAAVSLFVYNFEKVGAVVQLLISGDPGTLGMLESAGYTLSFGAYTQTKWDSFYWAVHNVAAAHGG